MITINEAVRIGVNNRQDITTPVGTFQVEQRNEGFADNDGRWLVYQNSELYWSEAGCLRRRRPGRHLGVFDTAAAAATAIGDAERQPVKDEMVR